MCHHVPRRASFPDQEHVHPRPESGPAALIGDRRTLLPLLLGLVGIAMAFLPTTPSSPGEAPRLTPGAPDPVGAPQTISAAPSLPRESQATETALFRRSETSPIRPRVVNRGAPPVRKPRTPDPEPSTDHFVVVDGESGAILYQRNAFETIAPASLTKIMTAVLAIEYGRLHEPVKVDVDAAAFPDSAVMGLRVDTEVKLEDLLYGLMLASGNDAAVAIARHIAGTEAAFARRMNDKAAWLALGGTHFANPHGFDATDHYSCPIDMVALARYAMQYPKFREVVSSRSHQVVGPYDSYTLHNVNAILDAYPGADGVKTGDTPMAGRSLVGTAVRDGHRVYVAFMRSTAGAVSDGTLLLDWAFDSHLWAPSTPPEGG